MSAMPMMVAATTALMSAAMMVAMMLPSLAAALWHYRRDLRALQTSHADARMTLFAVGYATVSSTVGLLLFALTMLSPSMSELPPTFYSLTIGAIVVASGVLQRSRWKARQLARCRQSSLSVRVSMNVATAWIDGYRFGLRCTASCIAPMTVLLVAGLMNITTMLCVTAAITAERLFPAGTRIARITGTVTVLAGAMICLRAVRAGGFVFANDTAAPAASRMSASASMHTRGTHSEHRPALSLHRRAAP
jgi:predicted metal-binding membrane protein